MKGEHFIFDAAGCSLGRLASLAAKKALLGAKVDIVNAEKALLSTANTEKYHTRVTYIGTRGWGPYFPKEPKRLVRRTIRGMLPWKRTRGREAYKRVRVFVGVPEKLEGKTTKPVKALAKSKIRKHITVGELSKRIGGKW